MGDRATAVFELPATPVSTLRCTACSNRACETLASIPGVAKVDCDARGAAVTVEYDPARVSESDLGAEMEHFGLSLAETFRHSAWRVQGLD